MPTPTGKPRKGERIHVQMPGGELFKGTVLVRYDGLSWGLKVHFDHKPKRQADHITEAGWMMRKGYLKCVS